ncbi:hypothetical protein ABPG72_013480 [Tetrahymena utriculariae]
MKKKIVCSQKDENIYPYLKGQQYVTKFKRRFGRRERFDQIAVSLKKSKHRDAKRKVKTDSILEQNRKFILNRKMKEILEGNGVQSLTKQKDSQQISNQGKIASHYQKNSNQRKVNLGENL